MAEAAIEGYEREGTDLHPAWGLRGVALVAAHQGRLDEARRFAARTDSGSPRNAATSSSPRSIGTSSGSSPCRSVTGRRRTRTSRRPRRSRRASRSGTPDGSSSPATRSRRRSRSGTSSDAAGDRRDARGGRPDRPDAVGRSRSGARSTGAARRGPRRPRRRSGDLRPRRARARRPPDAVRARRARCSPRVSSIAGGRRSASPTRRLRGALAVFEDLGAPVWADRARTELARVGLRPRAPEELTETERRSRSWRRSGLSSRQIAERAFLAPEDRRQRPRTGVREARDPLPRGARGAHGVGGARRRRPRSRRRAPLGRMGGRPGALIGVVASFVARGAGRTVPAMDRPLDPTRSTTFLVERYWPGIDLARLRDVLPRLEAAARAMTAEGSRVEHVGSILMPVDQVVFSLIAADDESARPAAQRASRPARRTGSPRRSRCWRASCPGTRRRAAGARAADARTDERPSHRSTEELT